MIQSFINTKIDPDKPAGIVYREIIDKIQRQVKNKQAAENLIDLAVALRDISIYQQKADELLSNGYVTDPNYKIEDLIREGVFLDLEDTSVMFG